MTSRRFVEVIATLTLVTQGLSSPWSLKAIVLTLAMATPCHDDDSISRTHAVCESPGYDSDARHRAAPGRLRNNNTPGLAMRASGNLGVLGSGTVWSGDLGFLGSGTVWSFCHSDSVLPCCAGSVIQLALIYLTLPRPLLGSPATIAEAVVQSSSITGAHHINGRAPAIVPCASVPCARACTTPLPQRCSSSSLGARWVPAGLAVEVQGSTEFRLISPPGDTRMPPELQPCRPVKERRSPS